jgi:hypothetical protein
VLSKLLSLSAWKYCSSTWKAALMFAGRVEGSWSLAASVRLTTALNMSSVSFCRGMKCLLIMTPDSVAIFSARVQ